jgi:TetR/AcrR family transcriptional repressor of nem operon
MPRPSNRDKILAEGLRLVHERGFAGASVRDIVQAAGVPQGSFTNHFASKEAFGLEVIERYAEERRGLIAATLLDASRPPVQRLAAFLDASRERLAGEGMRGGCLLGNFAAELSDHSEAIRGRLLAAFAEMRAALAACLADAVRAGALAADFDCDATAAFILASLQGATLLAKAERSAAPIDRLKHVLFEAVLRPPGPVSGNLCGIEAQTTDVHIDDDRGTAAPMQGRVQ